MVSCPGCDRDVDPLRARHTRVEGSRVVAYCSAECLAGQPTGGAAAVAPLRGSTTVPSRLPATAIPRRPDPTPPPKAASAEVPRPTRDTSADGLVIDETPSGIGPDLTAPIVTVEAVASAAHRAVPVASSASPSAEVNIVVDDVDLAPRRSRAVPVIIVGVVVIALGTIVGIRACAPPPPPVAPPRAPAPLTAPEPPPPPAAVDVAAARTQALDVLAGYLTSDSLRVRRLAAIALARAGDAGARDVLVALHADEPSEVARLEIAYALARADDPRGHAALVEAGRDRQLRPDAARFLLQLGDLAGVELLTPQLDRADRRLSAAEALARVGNERALAILREVRADESAGRDERARAAIALGRAGLSEATEALRALLTDGRFNAGAAAGLAALGDPAARPVLEEQLGVDGLRVDAAIRLRRLAPDLDPAPLLRALVAALTADRDVAQISAAEAILVLTGPAAAAARD